MANLGQSTWIACHSPSFLLRHFTHAYPYFRGGAGAKSAKFGLNLAFVALQFQNAMYVKFDSHVGNANDWLVSPTV